MPIDREGYPPVAFYFQVKIANEEYAFKEVSGLSTDLEVETVYEGGVNDFDHKLPKQVKHGNLTLKRGLLPLESNLITWVKKVLEGDFSQPIKPQDIQISLLNSDGKPIYTWTCQRAYPVKWNVDALDSEKNNLMIESLELAYTTLKRS